MEEIADFWSFLPWKPVNIPVPENIIIDPSWMGDPFVMAEKLQAMQRLRHRIAYHQGRLLRNIEDFHLSRELMFVNLGQYARERLGMSRNTLKMRLQMEHYFRRYPELQDEFFHGRLTQEQVRLLIQVFRERIFIRKEWIDFAQSVSALELSRTVRSFLRFAEADPHGRHSKSPWELRKDPGLMDGQMCAQDHEGREAEDNEDDCVDISHQETQSDA